MCYYFPSDEIPQSNKCQSLTLALSACKSLSATAAVMSRAVISPELPLLKTRADEQLDGAEQAFPKTFFSFVSLPESRYIGGTLKLASFLCSFCSLIKAL